MKAVFPNPALVYLHVRIAGLFRMEEIAVATNLIEDMRLLVSLVNWHRTFRLVHSVQLVDSDASH